jgi:hypothetical protein
VKHTKDKYDKEKAPNSDQHTLHKNNGSVTGKANCTFRIFVYILTEQVFQGVILDFLKPRMIFQTEFL